MLGSCSLILTVELYEGAILIKLNITEIKIERKKKYYQFPINFYWENIFLIKQIVNELRKPRNFMSANSHWSAMPNKSFWTICWRSSPRAFYFATY